jgi:aryl-alcohol dehydrogenase-like predicted oxidoreductase
MSHPMGQLVFGTAGLSSLSTQSQALRLLDTAYEQGIRHFDTAPLYGQGYAEWILGRFLRSKGTEVQVTDKFGLAGDVAPRIDPRIAMPLNHFRKRLQRSGHAPQHSGGAPHHARLPFRRITRSQLEVSLAGSLKRLSRTRIDCYMMHEGLPSFLDDDARTWLFRQQQQGVIGSLGVATNGQEILNADSEDFSGFQILQYEAGSIFDLLRERHPDKIHFLHSCFSAKTMENASLTPATSLSFWTNRNPDGKIIFFTRRPVVIKENIASILS